MKVDEEIKFVLFTHRPNYVTRIQWQVTCGQDFFRL